MSSGRKTCIINNIEIVYKLPGRDLYTMTLVVREHISKQLSSGQTAGTFRVDYCTGWWIIKKQEA
jgi:hypothetical protein